MVARRARPALPPFLLLLLLTLCSSGASDVSRRPLKTSDCRVTKEHVSWTLQKLRSAQADPYPYEHVVINEIFHPDLYECLQAHLPQSGAKYGGTISKGLRNYIRLVDQNGVALKEVKRRLKKEGNSMSPAEGFPKGFQRFWGDFAAGFAHDDIRDAWLGVFNATMALRFDRGVRRELQDGNLYYRMDITRDGKHYKIAPHTDNVEKVVTILFYLPRTAGHPELGTVVYRSKSGLHDSGTGKTWKPNSTEGFDENFLTEFEVVKKGAFVPNTVFAFAPCWSSWHGVFEVTEELQRDTIQGFVSMLTPKGKAGRPEGKNRFDLVKQIKGPCPASAQDRPA